MIIESKPMLERDKRAYTLLLEQEEKNLYSLFSPNGEPRSADAADDIRIEIEMCEIRIEAINNELKNKHEAN